MTTNDHAAFTDALECAARNAVDYLASLEQRPVSATADAAMLRSRLAYPLPESPTRAADVIAQLVRDAEPGLLASAGGRFFSWVIGGALPSALAADWLTATWDQNAAIYACSPAAAIVEEVAGGWLKELLGLPQAASFAFVTGCQMAHVTCLAAARHALLRARGYDVEERGLHGAPRIHILSSANRHSSIDRAVRLLGLGTQSLQFVPGDAETIDAAALDRALRADALPTIVLLQAGDINTGVFDDFERLIPIAKRQNAWVHIDGAFGLWAAASPAYAHLTRGVAAADSWATDGHKWLNVPFDCGYAFVAEPEAHRNAMSIRAPYISAHSEARDQIDWNPDWSRRARGFPTYAALRELGRHGVAELIERTCRHARELIEGLSHLRGAEVLWSPIINQGLVRFGDDAHTEAVVARVAAQGEALFGPTTWRGMRAMRVSVVNWRTTEDDIARAIEAVRRALDSCAASSEQIDDQQNNAYHQNEVNESAADVQ